MRLFLYTIVGGGAEKVSYSLCAALSSDHTVRVAATRGGADFFQEDSLLLLKPTPRGGTVLEIVRWIPAFFRLCRFVREFHPDVILMSGFQAMLVILKLLGLIVSPVVLILHSLPSNETERYDTGEAHRSIVRLLYRCLLRHVDRIVAVSQQTRGEMIEDYGIHPDRVTVIHNPLDLPAVTAKSREPLSPHEEKLFSGRTILNLGRLTQPKGQWHLIRAFKLVKERFPDTRLVIIGDGELRDYLQGLIDSLGLSGEVILLGFRENPYKYLARATVFAFPSLWEGFPYAPLEAMACGAPVVSSDCDSGPREILAPGIDFSHRTRSLEHVECGVLVPPCDGTYYGAGDPLSGEERILAAALMELLENETLRESYRVRGLSRAQEFTLERIAPAYADVLFGKPSWSAQARQERNRGAIR